MLEMMIIPLDVNYNRRGIIANSLVDTFSKVYPDKVFVSRIERRDTERDFRVSSLIEEYIDYKRIRDLMDSIERDIIYIDFAFVANGLLISLKDE